jgi:prepilin-type N-terminal cleavage/methylation domain-containing protein
MGDRRLMRIATRPARRGFTLFEILVTIAVIGIVAAVILPGIGDDRALRLSALSTVLISDIEYAQAATIANPETPIVVQFSPANNMYWLATAAVPNFPISRSDTGDYYFVVLGTGRASSAPGATLTVADMPNARLTFQAQGGLDDFTVNPVVRLNLDGRWRDIAITPTTGQISETSGP